MKKKIAYTTGGIVLFFILLYFISSLFLIYNKPVKSPYVLLEGWISYATIEDAFSYIAENKTDSVFVVGMKNRNASTSLKDIDKSRKLKKNGNTYDVYWSGILGFEIPAEKLDRSFTLHVNMRGTSDADHFSHYKIYVDKQLVGTGFVNEKDSVYRFPVTRNRTEDALTYLLIEFDNDLATSAGDRNLFIRDIFIDSLDIDSIATDDFFNSEIREPRFNFNSALNNIKYYIQDLGYDTSNVKLIEVSYDPINKTLALAEGAKKYFSNTEIESINILTTKKHSRRSYLNFKNCLEERMEVGCIPVNSDARVNTEIPDGVDERVSLLLTWIYWWFH